VYNVTAWGLVLRSAKDYCVLGWWKLPRTQCVYVAVPSDWSITLPLLLTDTVTHTHTHTHTHTKRERDLEEPVDTLRRFTGGEGDSRLQHMLNTQTYNLCTYTTDDGEGTL